MSDTPTTMSVALLVARALEQADVRYSIGGSMASSLSGEPRSTLDIDVVVALPETQISALVASLGDDFYVDEHALARAVARRASTNVIHIATSIKVDLFVAGGTVLDEDLLGRRTAVSVGSSPPASIFVHSPEDILLQKLRWYRLGGGVSERQWRDVESIVRVQGDRLDRAYLRQGAERLEVSDLLARALNE